jgi:hypothetical protein
MAEDTVWSTPESARISNAMENLENRVLSFERKQEGAHVYAGGNREEPQNKLEQKTVQLSTKIQRTSGGPPDF